MTWRWDQGRLDYFHFDAIRKIAPVLISLDGARLRGGIDPLRANLQTHTGMPFSPADYRVWRNYGRVFGCQLLAPK